MHTTLTARSLTTAGVAVAAVSLLLSGCSSAAKSAAGTSVAATSSASAPATAGSGASSAAGSPATPGGAGSTGATAPGAAPVVVHNADKGRTVTLHPGQTLEVVLTGGYWPVPASSSASVLHVAGAPTYLSPSPSQGCHPGTGCRPEQTSFTAVAPGTATVSATRTNCGEAMRCTAANGTFTITVTVAS